MYVIATHGREGQYDRLPMSHGSVCASQVPTATPLRLYVVLASRMCRCVGAREVEGGGICGGECLGSPSRPFFWEMCDYLVFEGCIASTTGYLLGSSICADWYWVSLVSGVFLRRGGGGCWGGVGGGVGRGTALRIWCHVLLS